MRFVTRIGVILCAVVALADAARAASIRRAVEPVPGVYLVQLRNVAPSNAPNAANGLVRQFGGRVRHVFQHAATGFSVAMTNAQAVRLADHPLVDFVEEVAVGHSSSEQLLPSSPPIWHLDRIDQHALPLDHRYDFCERANGVYVYVIDSGVCDV